MKNSGKAVLLGVALAATVALSACGERDQVTVYKQGKYQGKPDTKPWENGPGESLYTTSKWTQGDKTSWESALKTRNLAQNEYNRVE
jgi:major membrane immunogen (membrane-anchored lipoprotein)